MHMSILRANTDLCNVSSSELDTNTCSSCNSTVINCNVNMKRHVEMSSVQWSYSTCGGCEVIGAVVDGLCNNDRCSCVVCVIVIQKNSTVCVKKIDTISLVLL